MSPDTSAADQQWFDELFVAHARAIQRYFLRRAPYEEAEDLAADVLATAWRRRDDVPRGHELPWLYRTAGYVLANYRRKNRADPVEITEERMAAPGSDPAQQATDAATAQAVLAHLRPREREVLMLNAWDGLTGEELARALGMSRGGAAAALSRARTRLREIWQEQES